MSVSGDAIRLDRPAAIGVIGSDVWLGTVGLKIRGLRFDGSRQPGGSPATNPFPIHLDLTRDATVAKNTIHDGDHGAITLDRGSTEVRVEHNVLTDNGAPDQNLGASIWLFHGAHANLIRKNRIDGDSATGIYADDRTIASTEWDASAGDNIIEANIIDIPRNGSNCAIGILGSSNNIIRDNTMTGPGFGIRIYTGGQGSRPSPTTGNIVQGNTLVGHRYGLWVDGSANEFVKNSLRLVTDPIVDTGERNRFT
jgi:parallel beta-helix repeat protein